MHEAMVAENVLESILTSAKKQAGKPVRALITCGQFNAINDEAMDAAFTIAAEGTICEGMTLEVKQIPLQADCRACGKHFVFDMYNPICPKCNKSDFEIGQDADLLLQEIEFEG